MKVAQYEVLGRFFSKATHPASARDHRLAACAGEAVCEPRTEGSIVPTGGSHLLRLFPLPWWAAIKCLCGTGAQRRQSILCQGQF
jgi:hypothetical protein